MKFLTVALLLVVSLTAQENSELGLAMKLREESAREVKEKKATPEATMAKLRAAKAATGLKVDRETDFALAAIDVGQRLIAAGELEAAEKFFREAEKSLGHVIKKTPDSAAREKAAFLLRRAFVRSHFLNNPKDALADLDAALLLQPDNPTLKEARVRLRSEQGQLFTAEQTKQ